MMSTDFWTLACVIMIAMKMKKRKLVRNGENDNGRHICRSKIEWNSIRKAG